MKAFRNITVGIDFSKTSHAALHEAARIATWNGARLHVCHVAPPDELENFQWPETLPVGFLVEKARAKLRDFVVENLQIHPKMEFVVGVGNPFNELLKTVEETGSELLVLGSYGLGGRKDRTGVIATKCVRKVPVPVLLVREGQKGAFKKIVACTDFSETAARACEAAAELATQEGAHLHLLHIHNPPWAASAYLVYDLPEVWDDSYKAEYTSALDSELHGIGSELAKRFPDLEVTDEVVSSDLLSEGIAGFLDQHGADLVVLGTRGRTGFRSLLLGTTAEHLIRDSECSALVVKPEGFHYKAG